MKGKIMEPVKNDTPVTPSNPLFLFMGIGSLIYAFFYTLFLYQNSAGITYPFFVGGTCLFFFFYLKKSGITAKKDTAFYVVSLVLLGISTCLTDSWCLLFFNKLGIFLLFFCMVLHCLYDDRKWDLTKYISSVCWLLLSSVAFILHPFFDFFDWLKEKRNAGGKASGKGKYIFYGILIALPLLFVILLLLSSADAVFANLLDFAVFDRLFYLLDETRIFDIAFLFLFAFFASYCLLSRFGKKDIREEVPDRRNGEPVTAITFTSVISLVYLVFCIIQVVYLFAGIGALPEGYTYAGYARQGFFQLVFVCLLNLSLVLICIRYFRRNRVLKGLLTFISGCTCIMIASSVYRMLLYISVYQLTFLRVFVLWALFVIFLLMTGVTVMIYRENFPYFRYSMITVTVLYLLFSFAHPDYWIAKYNLSQIPEHAYEKETSQDKEAGSVIREDIVFDEYFMKRLSADAAPVIYSMAEEKGYEDAWWFKEYAEDLWYANHYRTLVEKPEENFSLRKWNLSRWLSERYYEKSDFDF